MHRGLFNGDISRVGYSLGHAELMPLFGGLLVLKLENEKDEA